MTAKLAFLTSAAIFLTMLTLMVIAQNTPWNEFESSIGALIFMLFPIIFYPGYIAGLIFFVWGILVWRK